MNKIKKTIRWIKRILVTALAVAMFVAIQGATPSPHGRDVLLIYDQADPALAWNGISNATYRVEQRTNLLSGAWNTSDPWRAPFSDLVTWPITEPKLPAQFFRVQFPSPRIDGGEPAFVPQAGGTTVYVTGRYFYEGDQIRVDGVLLANVMFISHNLLSGELPDLAPGLHDVDVLNSASGAVLTALPDALQVSPPFERTVQGPPEWPLAGPAPALAWRGHVTVLKLHSGGGEDDDCDGGPLDDWDGHVTVLKSHGGGDDDGDSVPDLRLYSGEVRQQAIDLAVPGRGLDFVWGRTYRSRTGIASSQGTRWTHSYDVRCVQNGDGTIEVCDGSGRKDVFRPRADGTYACPELFREGTLDSQTGIFRLTFANTGYWEFCPFNAASPDSGKLDQIVDRNGNTMTLNYDPAGRLTEVVDDLNRTNTVTYTPVGQVASVADFSGRTVTYSYSDPNDPNDPIDPNGPNGLFGDLKSVTSPAVTGTSTTNNFPAGKTTTYTYTANATAGAGSLLLSVIDALGQTNVQCTYDLNPASASFARCISIQYGTDAPTCLTYLAQTPAPDNRFTAMRCIVNDPEGNVSEHDFDVRNRCVALREYTGRATSGQAVTASANRPADKLRPDDPDVLVTTWRWNNDSLCTALTLPGVQSAEYTYQAALDPSTPPRFRANLRTERCIAAGDLDGDGLDDVAVTRFEHDPRFGTSEQVARQGFVVNTHANGLDLSLSFQPEGTKGVRRGVGFGSFSLSQRAARTGRNPQTGKEIKIAAKKVAKFKAGAELAGTVNRRETSYVHGETCDDGNSADDDVARVMFSVGNGMAIKTKGTGADKNRVAGGGVIHCPGTDTDCGGFVTRVINPRGFETLCEYDAHGNPTAFTQHGSGGGGVAPPVLAREDFEYNTYGQLTAHVHAADAQGIRRRDTCIYNDSGPQAGYLSSIAIDEQGVHLTTSYTQDARGNITNAVDARGTVTAIEVNTLGQVVAQVTQGTSTSERAACRFFYDAANNLVRSDIENRDGDGTLNPTNAWLATLYDYDALHQLTRLVEANASLTNTFAYNGNGQLVLARSPLAVQGSDPFHATRCEYDERGLPFRVIRAPDSQLQATTQCDYDANGNLRATRAGIEDADGVRVTEYTDDGFGRLACVTDPMGNETRFEYDLNDNIVCLTVFGETNDVPGKVGNIRLRETRYEYDARDCVVQSHDAFFDVFTQAPIGDGWRDTAIAYAPNGLVTATTNDLGHTTTFTFDTQMFLTGIVDAKTNRVDYAYDANGNLLSATETVRNDLGGSDEVLTRTFRYNALDRCVADWDNVGNTNSYAYDSRGNRVRHTDELGFNLEGDFDSVSRPTSNRKDVGGSAQRTARCVWDAASRLVADIDGNTNATAYAYDSLNRLVCTTLADGTSQTNAYDVHDNLVWTRDANGTEIFMAFDALGRCVQKDITPGEGVASDTTVETYQYDGLSHLVQAANDHTTVTRAYNCLGYCVHESTSSSALGFNPKEIGIDRVFDAHGRLLSQILPSGRVVEYEYDAIDCPVWMGWSTTAAEESMPLAAFAYAGPERLARVTRANGVQTDYAYSGLAGVANAPDDYGWGQVRRISHTLGGTTPIDTREFAFDRKQNKTVRAQVEPFVAGGPTNHQAFTYDSLDQLVSSVTTTNGVDVRYRDYTFDAVGNRTYLKLARNATPEPYTRDPTLPDPGDFQVNQYTTTPLDARQYDADGNLVQTVSGDPATPVTTSFVYDYADRLVAVTNATGPLAAYAYDAFGCRIAKIRYGESSSDPVLTNRYLYAEGQLIEEEDGDGVVLGTYAHLVEELGLGVERLSKRTSVAMIDGGGTVLFPLGDDQGSLLAITDAKGDVVERFDYDDYGTPSFLTSDGEPEMGSDGQPVRASVAGCPALFQGMHWDVETGLYWDGNGNPSPYMNKAELIDAIAKDAKLSQCPYFDPVTGRGLWRPYEGNNPYSPPQGSLKGPIPTWAPPPGTLLRGPIPPFAPPVMPTTRGYIPGGAIGGGVKAQDHNSSRSNKTAAIFNPDGGGGGASHVGLIVPIAINKGLRFKGGHDCSMSSIRNIK